MEELRETYTTRAEEEEEKQEEEAAGGNSETATSSRAPAKKKHVACWEATLQKFLTAQELGDTFLHAVVPMVTRQPGVRGSD